MRELLNAKDLSIGYGEKVLSSSLNLSIEKDKFISLLGPNGAGKSTLLRTLSGLHPPLHGEVFLEGRPIREWSVRERARMLSIVITESVNALLTLNDLVSLGRYPHTNWMGQLQEKDLRSIDFAIDSTGLNALREEKIAELSDGQVQKAMIARALAQDGDIILLDEPTAHLDIANRASVMKLLKELSREKSKGVLVSTHDLELAMEVSDEIWLMDQSGSLTTGIPEELMIKGEFNRVFEHEDLKFDREKGGFRISSGQHLREIGVEGKGVRLIWTQRALNRMGIEPKHATGHPSKIVVKDEEWILHTEQGQTTHKTLKTLLEAITQQH